MRNKKVLVSGGAGFIGKRLVLRLLEEGNQVIVIDKNTDIGICNKNISIYNLDISLSPNLSFLKDIDYVFHLAAAKDSAGEQACYDTNVKGTDNLIFWLKRLSPNIIKFIYIGTLQSEGFDKKSPSSLYGKTKLLAEEIIRKNSEDIPYVVIRSPRVYGPRDKRGIFIIFKCMKKGFVPIISDIEKRKASLIYIDDIIEAMFCAAESAITNKCYYISDGNIYSWKEIYEIMALALNKKYEGLLKIRMPQKVIKISIPLIRMFGKILNSSIEAQSLSAIDSKDWTCSPGEFFKDMGWKPRYFLTEGMKNTVNWLLEEKK
jgi:nucleoside-diphosphate-sugar epimerase